MAGTSKITGFEQAILNLIPPDAGYVLELGLKDNLICDYYSRRNPNAIYIKSKPESEYQKENINFNEQIVELIESFQKPGNLNEVDSCILFGNLFSEKDTRDQVKKLLGLIKEDCLVLMPFYNMEQLTNFKQFLKINYSVSLNSSRADAGIDNTPVTSQQLSNIFEQIGFYSVEIIKVNNENVFTKNNAQKQFIIRARKRPLQQHVLIHFKILNPVAACNDKRIHEPEIFLRSIPGVRTVISTNAMLNKKIENESDNKIFVWQRPIMTRLNSPEKLKKLIRLGFLVIVEFDDDPRRWQDIVDNDFLTFKGVHGIQTSTEVLAAYLRQFNPNVVAFENQMMELPQPAVKLNDGKIRIFFGALNREDDWRPILPVINRILGKYREKIIFNVVHDQNFYDELETPHKTFQPVCEYPVYLQLLQASDIALLPLEQSDFNQNKSDLKFIENAACHVVSLASPVVYRSSIKNGETGILYADIKEFEEKLDYLINNENVRLNISENAYQWVQQHRLLGQHFRRRYEWYQEMLGKLPQLNMELKSRVPGLF